MKKSKKKVSPLTTDILPLVRALSRVKKQAESLGLFTNDRELFECSRCGLAEDVAFSGQLITYYRGSGDTGDCGLRFERLDDSTFRCPVCKTKLKETPL
jgi:transposase